MVGTLHYDPQCVVFNSYKEFEHNRNMIAFDVNEVQIFVHLKIWEFCVKRVDKYQ